MTSGTPVMLIRDASAHGTRRAQTNDACTAALLVVQTMLLTWLWVRGKLTGTSDLSGGDQQPLGPVPVDPDEPAGPIAQRAHDRHELARDGKGRGVSPHRRFPEFDQPM